jgi:peptidoglycan/LPS O-acetylase OafA/YrhL
VSNPDRAADGAWDRWFRRFVAIVCLGLLVYEAVAATTDRPYLIGALVVLILGAPVAVVTDAWLGRRRGNGGS